MGSRSYNASGAEKVVGAPYIPLVSSLPGSPVDGQMIRFLADATNGVEWLLAYNAASSSSYKWEFLGGSPLRARINPGFASVSETTASTTYVDLATVGPSVVAPLAGDYALDFGCVINIGGNQQGMMSIMYSGANAVDADCAWSGESANWDDMVKVGHVITGIAAAATVKARYRSGGGSQTGDFRNRWMNVVPVRVG